MSIITRQLSIVAALVVIFGAIIFMNVLSDKKEAPKKKKTAPIVREVAVFTPQTAKIPTELQIQGQLVAYNKIDLFSEVTGMLLETGKPFKKGTYFPKGTVLFKIDNQETQLNLLAQKSALMNAITQLMPNLQIDYPASFQQWKTYLDAFDIQQNIKAFPTAVNDQEKYLIASRNLLNQYYTIKSAEERLKKYTVYAPFSGVLTQTNINSGTIVRAGQKLGELMNSSSYELEATVSLADLKYVKVGRSVNLISDEMAGEWSGKVKRISNQIDPNTQSVLVYISVQGKNLREGMYLRGQVNAGTIDNAVEIPKDLLVDQNAVFVVKDSALQKLPVNIIKMTPKMAIIQSLDARTQLVKTPISGAFEGMKVTALKQGK